MCSEYMTRILIDWIIVKAWVTIIRGAQSAEMQEHVPRHKGELVGTSSKKQTVWCILKMHIQSLTLLNWRRSFARAKATFSHCLPIHAMLNFLKTYRTEQNITLNCLRGCIKGFCAWERPLLSNVELYIFILRIHHTVCFLDNVPASSSSLPPYLF